MLGLVRPCSTHLDAELRDRWRAHLCGLCLTLRDTAGQPARAVTNTDAVLLSVLVEAQQPDDAATRTAGPCPLRGMRRARVIAPTELSVRLGATAALTLASAKVGDRAAEHEHGLAGRTGRAGTVGLLRRAEGHLAGTASADPPVASAANVESLLGRLRSQAAIEAGPATLAEVTAPSADAAAAMFAASADLAGRPQNATALADAGRAYGEFAHLADALEDLESDRKRGAYNPLDATGTTPAQAVTRMRELRRRVVDRLAEVELRDDRLVRPLLLAAMGGAIAAAAGGGMKNKRPITERSLPYRTLAWVGVYCTGYALCCDHTDPCTGKQRESGCSWCEECDCETCDGCGSCCECGDCCDCGDGCCCDCGT